MERWQYPHLARALSEGTSRIVDPMRQAPTPLPIEEAILPVKVPFEAWDVLLWEIARQLAPYLEGQWLQDDSPQSQQARPAVLWCISAARKKQSFLACLERHADFDWDQEEFRWDANLAISRCLTAAERESALRAEELARPCQEAIFPEWLAFEWIAQLWHRVYVAGANLRFPYYWGMLDTLVHEGVRTLALIRDIPSLSTGGQLEIAERRQQIEYAHPTPPSRMLWRHGFAERLFNDPPSYRPILAELLTRFPIARW